MLSRELPVEAVRKFQLWLKSDKNICYERPTRQFYVTPRVFVGGGKCF
jgi:hypothetical protein